MVYLGRDPLTKGRETQARTRQERRASERALAKQESRVSPSMLYPAPVLACFRALSDVARMELLGLLEGRAERQLTFREYIDRVHPGYLWGAHLVVLCRVLQDVADGLRTRVMCFMPPRHGKSEMISRLFAAYYLYRHGGLEVALTTYGAELSYELSRQARDNYVQGGGVLADNATAVKMWYTALGGRLWASGVGGPATGRGFHLGIIDDPYKDHGEAASEIVRKARFNWFKSVFMTRKAPGAAVVILLTRWHQLDLVGELLKEEELTQERWHVLEFPAERYTERSDSAQRWPSTVTRETDARDHGAWLWTARFPASEYEATRRSMGGSGGYFWNALYQQRPIPADGGLFKREWFKRVPRTQVPRGMIGRARSWDLAATEGDNAYTAGLRVDKSAAKDYYILNLQHGQWHPGVRDTTIKATAKLDGPNVMATFPIDPGAAGKQVAHQFPRMLDGISPVLLLPQSGSKTLRATMPASAASNGQLYIVDEPWAEIVITECCAAGEGAAFWDIVDALSSAFAYLGPIGDTDEPPRSYSMRTNR